MNKLTLKQYKQLFKYHKLGLSTREIAKLLNISHARVAQILSTKVEIEYRY